MGEQIIKVQTPLGELIAKSTLDPMYPGIALDFIKKGQEHETPVALLECNKNEEEPDGGIRLLVWGDKEKEDYTDEFKMLSSDEPIVAIEENRLVINGVFVSYELSEDEIEEVMGYIEEDDYHSIIHFLEQGEDCVIGGVGDIFREVYIGEDSCSECLWLITLITDEKKKELLLGRDDVTRIGDRYIYTYVC